jgi:hypothetical protein
VKCKAGGVGCSYGKAVIIDGNHLIFKKRKKSQGLGIDVETAEFTGPIGAFALFGNQKFHNKLWVFEHNKAFAAERYDKIEALEQGRDIDRPGRSSKIADIEFDISCSPWKKRESVTKTMFVKIHAPAPYHDEFFKEAFRGKSSQNLVDKFRLI